MFSNNLYFISCFILNFGKFYSVATNRSENKKLSHFLTVIRHQLKELPINTDRQTALMKKCIYYSFPAEYKSCLLYHTKRNKLANTIKEAPVTSINTRCVLFTLNLTNATSQGLQIHPYVKLDPPKQH